MQMLIIAGTLGRDAELRDANGEKVLNFSVAVDNGKDRDGGKREPTWFRCALWGKRAESAAPYFLKGTRLTLTGRPTARAHDDKAYLGLTVDQFSFMGKSGGGSRDDDRGDDRRDDRRDEGRSGGGSGGGSGYGSGGRGGFDDEIPFAPEWR